MIPVYAAKLRLQIRRTDVETQKIDRSILLTYDIVLINFQMENKEKIMRFFQKTFSWTTLL